MDTIFNPYGVVAAFIVSQAETGVEPLDRVATIIAIAYMILCVVVKVRDLLHNSDAKRAARKVAEKKDEEKKDDGGV